MQSAVSKTQTARMYTLTAEVNSCKIGDMRCQFCLKLAQQCTCKYLQTWCKVWPQQERASPCGARQHRPCRHPGWWWFPQTAHSCAHTWGHAEVHAPESGALGTGPAPTPLFVKAHALYASLQAFRGKPQTQLLHVCAPLYALPGRTCTS